MTPMAPRMRSCESRNGATTIEQPVLANNGLSAPEDLHAEATLASSSRRTKLSPRSSASKQTAHALEILDGGNVLQKPRLAAHDQRAARLSRPRSPAPIDHPRRKIVELGASASNPRGSDDAPPEGAAGQDGH